MLWELRRQQKGKCFDDIFETIRNSNRRCVVICFHFVGTTTHSNGHESAVDQTIESSRADSMRAENKRINKERQLVLLSPLYPSHKKKRRKYRMVCVCVIGIQSNLDRGKRKRMDFALPNSATTMPWCNESNGSKYNNVEKKGMRSALRLPVFG